MAEKATERTVLIVVDVQVGVMATAWDSARVIANVAKTVSRARAAGVPVIWVQHHDEELVTGTDDWQWVPELVPLEGEVRVHKSFNSAFENTSLNQILADRGVTKVVLAGAATNWCIRATAYGALERGFNLVLVNDAHTTGDLEWGTEVIEAKNIIRELNVVMSYVSYPGRTNQAVPADEVMF